MENQLSQSLEEYLEAIFLISKKKKTVRIKDLVNHLDVKSASVIGAIKKLEKNKLVVHEHYGSVELTEKGKILANEIYEKHRILYTFFTDVLKVDKKTAERDACLMEHNISEATLKGIIRLIKEEGSYQKFPLTDDREPLDSEATSVKIPWGRRHLKAGKRLTGFSEGDRVKITEVDAGAGAMIHLKNLGLQVGNILQIHRISHLKGPIVVVYRDTDIAIGYGLAKNILVEEA